MFPPPPGQHPVPKCLRCGAIGQWHIEPILLGIHWIIGGIFLLAAGGGLVYLLVSFIYRSNPDRRAKICAHCKSRGMFTFVY